MRKGMQLAVNTLVVLVLGFLITGLAIALVYNIYDKSVDLATQVPIQTERQLLTELDNSNQAIAVFNNVRTVERGDAVLFPVAIRNKIDAPSATLIVKDPGLPVVTNGCDQPGFTCPVAQVLSVPYTLDRFDAAVFHVFVEVPKEVVKGEYTFRLEVYKGSDSSAWNDPNNLYARSTIGVNIR